MADNLTATNPSTGEKLAFVGEQWIPVDATASNPETGEKMYQSAGEWKSFGINKQNTKMPDVGASKQQKIDARFDGPREGALYAASGLASSIAGGWRGLATLATGGSLDDAANAVTSTQKSGTYEPITAAGKKAADQIRAPINFAKSDEAIGAGEAALNFGSQIAAAVPASVAALSNIATNGKYGTQAGVKEAGDRFSELANAYTYEPRSEKGKEYSDKISQAINDSGVIGLMPVSEIGIANSSLASRNSFKGRSPVSESVKSSSTPVNYDTPSYIRNGAAEPIAAPMADTGISAYLKDSNFMRSLSDADRQSLLESYQTSQNTNVAAPVRQLALSQVQETIGRNLATTEKAATPSSIAGAVDDIDAIMGSIGKDGDAATPRSPIQPKEAMRSPVEQPEVVAPASSEFSAIAPTESLNYKLTPEQVSMREKILRDVGMQSIRESAVEGDALRASSEYGMGNFDELAGRASKEQFQHEIDSLTAHVKKSIPGTRGTLGLDESSLDSKGQIIAAPFDAARGYFEAAKKNLYDEANKRAGEMPLKSTENIDSLLKDPEFNNTAMADDQLGLVNAIQKQFDLYKERNKEGGLTVENAEQFRKWLNQRWRPDNRSIISDVKAALDNDVFSNAGEDVFAKARQMHQSEKAILDSKSIAKLMDSDPYDPVHRSTSYSKIADSIIKMSPAEFENLLTVMKSFPDEIQASVKQAISTIKAHYGDRLIKSGSETKGGNDRPVWGAAEVNNFINDNSLKFEKLFDTPDEIQAIRNFRDAGNIISTNPAYPGAAAQTANAMKKGLMSKVAGKLATSAGAGVGAVFGGGVGAAPGALFGEIIGNKITTHLGERKALEDFKKGLIERGKNEQQLQP